MNMFRGTPEPESKPAVREYECVFFAWHYVSVVDFATDGETSKQGYIQEYRFPDDLKVYDLDAEQALVQKFTGRVLTEPELRELLYDPPKEWIRFLKDRGYQGIAGEDYVCLFDAKAARLIRRWKLEYQESTREYKRTLIKGR